MISGFILLCVLVLLLVFAAPNLSLREEEEMLRRFDRERDLR